MSEKGKPVHDRELKYAAANTRPPKGSKHGAKIKVEKTKEDRWR